MAAVSFVLLVAVLVGYVQWSINHNNRLSCGILASETEAPPRPPVGAAQTPVGADLQRYNRELAARQARHLILVEQLQHQYGCG